MKTTIQEKLTVIEKKHGVKILYSCESGSRAWGFPSPDSDYDVRFIYTYPLDKYLSVKKPAEQFTFPINDELDISGWDLQKTLSLICRSNSVPFEWLQSPIVYKEDSRFKNEIWELCQSYFCPRTNIHHYMGIAKGAVATIDGEQLKLKKLFYILRPLLAARWCVDRKTIAPMNIFPLMELLPADIKQKVLSLIELKASADESYRIRIDSDIKLWIEGTFDYCTNQAELLDKKGFDTGKADEFFRKIIMEK